MNKQKECNIENGMVAEKRKLKDEQNSDKMKKVKKKEF